MPKETFYFSHDYNSRNDPKMIRLFMKTGISGIGVYWCIIEMLYEQGGYMELKECERIAFELRTDSQIVSDVIQSDLFGKNNEKFWSESAIRRLNERKIKTVKARESATIRWDNAKAMRTHSDTNAIKEIKEKEIKENIRGRGDFQSPQSPLNVFAAFTAPDGSIVKTPTIEFKKEDFNGIPDDYANQAMNLVKSVKQVDITHDRIKELWESFKMFELHKKLYRSKEDVYAYFSTYCRKQAWSKVGIKKATTTTKQQKNEKIVGVEFVNDFTQCKMSDGSLVELNANQRDSAKYNMINPSSIVK